MTKIRLLADRVLVKVDKVDDKATKSGIIIPTVNTDEAPMQGTVCEVSKKVANNPLEEEKVAVGDKVIFSKYAGSDVELDFEKYKVLRISDIFGCVEAD